MIEERAESPEVRYSHITPDGAWIARRVCSVILAAWLGGILLVSLSAPAVFRAGDVVLRHPLPAHAEVIGKAGRAPVSELLRYHAGEANNQMFRVWGAMQALYGASVLLLLLFFTDVGKWRLILSASLLALALFQWLYLIPAIADATRRLRVGEAVDAGKKFSLLHGSFAAFELASAVLGLTLLVWLLRTGRRDGRRRARG